MFANNQGSYLAALFHPKNLEETREVEKLDNLLAQYVLYNFLGELSLYQQDKLIECDCQDTHCFVDFLKRTIPDFTKKFENLVSTFLNRIVSYD